MNSIWFLHFCTGKIHRVRSLHLYYVVVFSSNIFIILITVRFLLNWENIMGYITCTFLKRWGTKSNKISAYQIKVLHWYIYCAKFSFVVQKHSFRQFQKLVITHAFTIPIAPISCIYLYLGVCMHWCKEKQCNYIWV